MYDEFSSDYDRFINWEKRLAHELTFIKQQLETGQARRVLDVACGTGKHAIALAEQGYDVTGVDLSAKMIAQAKKNAAAAESTAHFLKAGFGELAAVTAPPYDALLCMGSSLPHVLTIERLQAALEDFAAVLRPGGLLLIQNRNFDAVMSSQARWMPPLSHQEDNREWVFLRFYDFNADGSLTFNVVTLRREQTAKWTQQAATTHLYPWRCAELTGAVARAGFDRMTSYGDMNGTPFESLDSKNLVIIAYH